jgi:hypothetical protein
MFNSDFYGLLELLTSGLKFIAFAILLATYLKLIKIPKFSLSIKYFKSGILFLILAFIFPLILMPVKYGFFGDSFAEPEIMISAFTAAYFIPLIISVWYFFLSARNYQVDEGTAD